MVHLVNVNVRPSYLTECERATVILDTVDPTLIGSLGNGGRSNDVRLTCDNFSTNINNLLLEIMWECSGHIFCQQCQNNWTKYIYIYKYI